MTFFSSPWECENFGLKNSKSIPGRDRDRASTATHSMLQAPVRVQKHVGDMSPGHLSSERRNQKVCHRRKEDFFFLPALACGSFHGLQFPSSFLSTKSLHSGCIYHIFSPLLLFRVLSNGHRRETRSSSSKRRSSSISSKRSSSRRKRRIWTLMSCWT